VDVDWVELDGWQRETGRTFSGSVAQLADHLRGLVENGRVATDVQDITLIRVGDHLAERVRTTVTTFTTPWGKYRWIPRPRPNGRRKGG
jgi:hypothetical protein